MENSDEIKRIIEPLDKLYKKYRSIGHNVSTHTKSAQQITKLWQASVVSDNIKSEVPIKKGATEKIDVVDQQNKTAYELKVSGKNVKHEFYKDLFKVLTFNKNSENFKLENFIFISEMQGIKRLEKSTLFKECCSLLENNEDLNQIILKRI